MENYVNDILNVFERYRMTPLADIDQYEATGRAILADKIANFAGCNKSIEFAMLGFPFKSTNERDKVLGKLPDQAEQATLDNFAQFNRDIKKVYEPGVHVSIISDGYIFNDLLGVEDKTVAEYGDISKHLQCAAPMKWYDLNSFYAGPTLASKRNKVMEHFGISNVRLEQAILTDLDVNLLYRGMIHFMQEEESWKDYPSKSQLQKAAKKLAREMMFRNEAYSNLVRQEFSDHIRLSMHPSINNGEKYSFQLIPGKNAHHSAWHCALVIKGEELITMHKIEAERLGYEKVFINGRPFYFTAA